jgi:hypothetical protein
MKPTKYDKLFQITTIIGVAMLLTQLMFLFCNSVLLLLKG